SQIALLSQIVSQITTGPDREGMPYLTWALVCRLLQIITAWSSHLRWSTRSRPILQSIQPVGLIPVKPEQDGILVKEGPACDVGSTVTLRRVQDHLATAAHVRTVRATIQMFQRGILCRRQMDVTGWWHVVIYLIASLIIHQVSAIPNLMSGAI